MRTPVVGRYASPRPASARKANVVPGITADDLQTTAPRAYGLTGLVLSSLLFAVVMIRAPAPIARPPASNKGVTPPVPVPGTCAKADKPSSEGCPDGCETELSTTPRPPVWEVTV